MARDRLAGHEQVGDRSRDEDRQEDAEPVNIQAAGGDDAQHGKPGDGWRLRGDALADVKGVGQGQQGGHRP